MTDNTPVQRIENAIAGIRERRKQLDKERVELRGVLGRIESRFRDLVTTFAAENDQYSGEPVLSIETNERRDGEKAITLRVCNEYVLEIGTHERTADDSSEVRRGFYAYSNVQGSYTQQFMRHIANMQGVKLLNDEPVFVFRHMDDRQTEKWYTLTPETLFALFLENASFEIDEDSRLYNTGSVSIPAPLFQ
jgi:hypothetical protein